MSSQTSETNKRIAKNTLTKDDLKALRKERMSQLEEQLNKSQSPEDDMFYYHSSEDRIVLSHALFWVMTASIRGKMAKEKYLLLLRQYEEELLTAWLTESPDFSDLLHYCNVIYNTLPIILRGAYNFSTDKDARRLAAICVVAGGYGGDMPDDAADELLDDIDFVYNKVKCRAIECLLPTLNRLVVEEQQAWNGI